MSKPCTNQQATARLRVHSPASELRKHVDFTTALKDPTDAELFSSVLVALMKGLGYTNIPAFFVGFLLDCINQMPISIRDPLAAGILLGLGMEVTTDEEGVTVTNVPRYEPLPLPEGQSATTLQEKIPGFVESEGGVLVPSGVRLPHYS